MKYWLASIFTAFFAYFIGSLSTMILASNFVFKANLRRLGKGSRWISNFTRVHGWKGYVKLALVELVRDLVPILIGGLMFRKDGNAAVGQALAAFCMILGRCWPMIYDLKGGYATAMLVIASFFISISTGLIVLAVVILITFLTRYLSVGTLAGAIMMAILAILSSGGIALRLYIFLAVLILIRCIPSFSRIATGAEEKLSFQEDLAYKFDEKF